MRAPIVWLVDGGEADVRRVAERLRRDGWHPAAGFKLGDLEWFLGDRAFVISGVIRDRLAARDVVSALARGVSAVVAFDSDAAMRNALLDDAQHLGQIETVKEDDSLRVGLTSEQQALLDLLASGASIPEASRRLHVSVRTAERRLRDVRRLLGVRTTAEAVARAAGAPEGQEH